jgi:murein DD-endopeptidase MepM/ murein hydrolase activator NlpD
MMRTAFKYLLVCTIISASCHGATRSSLKSSYLKAKGQVRSLKSKIRRLENKLNKNNNKYIRTVKRRQAIDLEIFEIERSLQSAITHLEEKQLKLDKEYKLLLLNSLEDLTTEDLMTKKIVLNRIRKDREEINAQLSNQRKLKKRSSLLRSQFASVIEVEKELYSLVQRLESDKQDYVKTYMKASEKSVTLRAKLKKTKKRRVVKKKKKQKRPSRNTYAKRDFVHPVEKYVTLEHDQKGVYYIFKETSDIKVSKSGTVVHVGTLANYGNVVMIDHGNELKSIFLGSLISNVSKGDRVEAGSIIGETRKSVNQNVMGKVYFEVRQKNKVQNTIKLVRNNQTQA